MDRRSFLAAGGGLGLICTLNGERVVINSAADVARLDARAAAVPRPAAVADPIDRAQFPTPEPQPGGRRREYWIAARSVMWDPAPTGRDEWMKQRLPRRRSFRALVYQEFSSGFANPIGRARMPGPTLYAEVGDLIVVHFRNAERKLRQAVTMHPHGRPRSWSSARSWS